jgi:hypothetical protein
VSRDQFDPTPLYRAGGIAALVQLFGLALIGVVLAALGPRPETTEAFFAAYSDGAVWMVLRGDLIVLALLIVPYVLTFPALYLALRRRAPLIAPFCLLFTVMAVTLCLATESSFSLLHLAELHAAATTAAERSVFAAAAEAVIAGDMWHSTAAFASGILLQGSGVAISLVMLGSRDFHRITAWSGLLGNGLDLTQHLLHPVVPGFAAAIMSVMGLFYLVWFPMLARDLLRLGARSSRGMRSD